MTASKKLTSINRRRFLGMGIATLGTTAVSGLALAITPSQAEGPFYPNGKPVDSDTDLTHLPGQEGQAEGDILRIEGRVLDESLEPIPDALVEIWQANAFGRYHHERDTSSAPLDPNFQGWGQMVTGVEGQYGFITIKPGAYPAANNWIRPPHIHFKVARRGFRELITQLYFANDPLNSKDRLLAQVDPKERDRLIKVLRPDQGIQKGVFDIVLKKV